MSQEFVRHRDACAELGIGPSTGYARQKVDPNFPRPVHPLGPGTKPVAYLRSELEAYKATIAAAAFEPWQVADNGSPRKPRKPRGRKSLSPSPDPQINRSRGRPRGSKDTAPRKPRQTAVQFGKQKAGQRKYGKHEFDEVSHKLAMFSYSRSEKGI